MKDFYFGCADSDQKSSTAQCNAGCSIETNNPYSQLQNVQKSVGPESALIIAKEEVAQFGNLSLPAFGNETSLSDAAKGETTDQGRCLLPFVLNNFLKKFLKQVRKILSGYTARYFQHLFFR